MKSPARLGWLVAILVALSLVAPFTSPVSAAQTDATPTDEPSQVVTSTGKPVPTRASVPDDTGVGALVPTEVVDAPPRWPASGLTPWTLQATISQGRPTPSMAPPATGSGSSGGAWFMLGLAVVGIAGLGGIALRRKPSGR